MEHDYAERFVINDLMDNSYSVTWPGYEAVVCNNEAKFANLLKILFNELEVEDAVFAVKKEEYSGEELIVTIPWMTYHQNPSSAARFLERHYSVVGCKFDTRELAEAFKLNMERRLAWRRLSGKAWA